MKEDSLEDLLSRFLVATSDYADDGLPLDLQVGLATLRERFQMDVVFVARFKDGLREVMCVDKSDSGPPLAAGRSDPLEESWCHSIVQGRIPQLLLDAKPLVRRGELPYTPLEIGTHLSVPVLLPSGDVYGTLCAFSLQVVQGVSTEHVEALRLAARRLGERLCSDRVTIKRQLGCES